MGSAMIHRILCKLGFHAWREVGRVCVYGDGKWVGPFMQFDTRAIKIIHLSECQHCNKRKERVTYG